MVQPLHGTVIARREVGYVAKKKQVKRKPGKESGKRTVAQAVRRQREAAWLTHPEHLRPGAKPAPKPGSRAYKKLQQDWYNKLAKAELKKPEDQRWTDIEWAENPNSPHIKKPSSRSRVLTPGKQLYYALARNFLTHFRFRHLQEKEAWSMHTDGKSYREIQTMLSTKYGIKKSIWWIYYYVQSTAKKCQEFNTNHREGLLNAANSDGFATDALLVDFSMEQVTDSEFAYDLPMDAGYWESVPKKN
jgi:hypothetical protein